MTFNVGNFGWCVVGVLISVLLPVLWQSVRGFFPKAGAPASLQSSAAIMWPLIKPYLVLGLASIVTALLIFAFAGNGITDYRAAILAGYAWDSTLQKLKT